MELKKTFLLHLLIIFISISSLPSAAETSSKAALSPVVSTDWLAEHLEDPDLITLHIGPPGSYEKGHIPGARKASLRRLIRINEAGIRDEMLPSADLAKALSELGIDESSRIVIYFSDEQAAWAAARSTGSEAYTPRRSSGSRQAICSIIA